ncbi:TRAPPC5/Trs31 [Giardia muris]|uniref:TRAPPC5/Trs31 n=1 Tax=Giardia muris TaxID=5742 RepID=A0A4Z1T4V3_GIAMU|nr:TRAPPC5/Trs31 [Giardia muris]|eukprot:TNJ27471.1 TRAPPC5/Trs31 [Giardia muris]
MPHSELSGRASSRRGQGGEMPLSTLVYVLNEYFLSAYRKADSVDGVEASLVRLGRAVGRPLWVYASTTLKCKSSVAARPESLLQYIKDSIWPLIFSRPATDASLVVERKGEFILRDELPVLERYISYSKGDALLSMFTAGVLEGIFACCGYQTKVVSYHEDTNGVECTSFHITVQL